jgi:uncharacterized tellurite resistance protein B-like protein
MFTTPEEKRVYMLLKTVIYHYHGLDKEEKADLERTALEMNAQDEYRWALQFIAKDHLTAFDRARSFLNEHIADYPREKRIALIHMVWEANNVKGYVTEMEATAMLKLARDWNVERELIEKMLR